MERIGNVLRTVLPPILRGTTCPHCGVAGTIELFDEPANGGLGLRCTACQVRRPWQELPQWLPQFSRRRSNPIRSLVQGTEPRCYLCGMTEEQLKRFGRGLQTHHVVPHVVSGDDGPMIPLCTQCHEIARALQHSAGQALGTQIEPGQTA